MTNEQWLNGLSTEDKANILSNGICPLCAYNASCFSDCKDCKEGITKYLQQTHVEPMPELVKGDMLKLKFMYDNGNYRLVEATYLGRDIICIHYEGVTSIRPFIDDITEIYRLAENNKRMELIWKRG